MHGLEILADANSSDHMSGWGWGMMFFGWLFMAAIVVLAVWVIWSATRQSAPPGSSENRARALLDERYARGEIDRDEYLERCADVNR